MPRANLLLFAGLLGPTFAAGPADAACTVSTTAVAFGSYDPQNAAPDDGVGSVRVACHPSDPNPNVALGTGSSGTFSPRTMQNGGFALNYNLYTTTARNIVWGNGTGGSVTVTLTGGTVNAGQRTYNRTIFGRVPGAQNVGAGSYSDTLIVTVTY